MQGNTLQREFIVIVLRRRKQSLVLRGGVV